jgi:hypothetical protein
MMDWELGSFGDERLEKRGPICWSAWCLVRACAFVGLRGGAVERLSGSAGSWRTAV